MAETPKTRGTPQLFPPPHHPQCLKTALEAVRRQRLCFTPKQAALPGFARDAPLLPHPLDVSTHRQPGSTRDGALLSPLDTAAAPRHAGITLQSISCAGAEPHGAPGNPKLCRAKGLPGTLHTWGARHPTRAQRSPQPVLATGPPQRLLSSPLLNPAQL